MECDATAWLVDFPNPYSHRHRGRNPFAQHLNYPKINSSTKDYPKTTLIYFFCILPNFAKMRKGTIRKLSDKVWDFFDYLMSFRDLEPTHELEIEYCRGRELEDGKTFG